MNKYVESIDFVTVVYKRINYAKLIYESIKKYVDYPYKFYVVNNGDNSKDSAELKSLKKMFAGEDNVIVINGIQQVNQDDGVCVPPMPNQKYSQQYFIDNYGWDGYSKYDKRPLGFASWLQAEAMSIGTKIGNGKYVCQVEHDVIFLNKWVNDILPLLDNNSFVSYAWREDIDQALTPQWSVLKRKTIENNFYREPGDLYPNCHYKDTYGLLSLWAREFNKPYVILENSFENRSLKSKHVLDVPFGEEGFINGVPFMHHGSRGAIRSEDHYNMWVSESSKYLNITI
jgi:hypothetical protein|tara:strand:+ start:1698 stop:2555 length:858 start_codon:yes stop_codon:yes gene_type:complete